VSEQPKIAALSNGHTTTARRKQQKRQMRTDRQVLMQRDRPEAQKVELRACEVLVTFGRTQHGAATDDEPARDLYRPCLVLAKLNLDTGQI
jgi:hypothetical protein